MDGFLIYGDALLCCYGIMPVKEQLWLLICSLFFQWMALAKWVGYCVKRLSAISQQPDFAISVDATLSSFRMRMDIRILGIYDICASLLLLPLLTFVS